MAHVNPTVPQFVSALKTSLINGLVFVDVAHSNCSEEENEPGELLTNLQEFFSQSPDTSSAVKSSSSATCSTNLLETSVMVENAVNDNVVGKSSAAYVAGSIARRIVIDCICEHCKQALLASTCDETLHSGIAFREYSSKVSGLTYPSAELIACIETGARLIDQLIPEVAHEGFVRSTVTSVLSNSLNFNWLQNGCSVHAAQLRIKVLAALCSIALPWWCTRRNRELSNSTRVKSNLRKLKILQHQ